MINEFFEKLAKLAINYAIRVKKGDRVFISGPTLAEPLFQAIYVEILKAGGHPLLIPYIEGSQELLYKYASEDQLLYLDNATKLILNEFNGCIEILGDYNTHKLSLIEPEKIAKYRGSPARKELLGILMKRVEEKDLNYLVVPYPCNSLAQEANMDLFSYTKFVQKALYLDKEDPVKEWLEVEKKQEKICTFLNNINKIQVIGIDTDLTLSVKGRKWINSCGRLNLPDGEVYTGPVEASVNGHIRFTFPGIYQGREIENIFLEFKEGKVVRATADKGEDLLNEILKIENADILGEFAIGTNYGIKTFTKNMLFDEKMGGTIHCALGLGIAEAGSKNVSAIHWDILKDMRLPGSKVLADDKVIYEEGEWKT